MSQKTIPIPASKSLSNRLLILQHLYPDLTIENSSTANDTEVLQKALKQIKMADYSPIQLNTGHAGTAMRFLTALLTTMAGKSFILEGSDRMHKRPIGVLVEALRQLGADIEYLKNEGYPPLKINGKFLTKNQVRIAQNISSQYISALLLIAPKLPDGLQIDLTGEQVSKPYVKMTLEILKDLGIQYRETASKIRIFHRDKITSKQVFIEGDWSSVSYFYGAAAILKTDALELKPFDRLSLQGDAKITDYFRAFGIKTGFAKPQTIKLTQMNHFVKPGYLEFDLIDTPDLAQTLAVTCLAMGIKCHLTGLQTLRIKETDRLAALKTEMEKLGATVNITDSSLSLINPVIKHSNVSIDTYDDHRMAMSFAILQKKFPTLKINHPEVVRKSFPDFWEQFSKIDRKNY